MASQATEVGYPSRWEADVVLADAGPTTPS
jgi:hypothetical protein